MKCELSKKPKYKELWLLFLMLFFTLSLTACQKKTKSQVAETEEQEQEVYYRIQEKVLPNPDDAIMAILGPTDEEIILGEVLNAVRGDTVYRIAHIIKKEDGMIIHTGTYYLQILESPYTEWKNYYIESASFDDNNEDYSNYGIQSFGVTVDEKVYCVLQKYDWIAVNDEWELDKNGYYLAQWDEQGSNQILCDIPEAMLIDADETKTIISQIFSEDMFSYAFRSDKINWLSKGMEEAQVNTFPGIVWGIIQNPSTGSFYRYGIQEDRFGIWSWEGGTTRLEQFEKIGKFDELYVSLACSANDTIYLSNERYLWRIDNAGEVLAVSDFLEQGYVIDDIYDMSVQDETVTMYLLLDDDYCLLTASEGERPKDKIELTISGAGDYYLQQTIARFNRRSEKYHMNILLPEKDETYYEYYSRLQLEAAAGKAPDIYNMSDTYAEGYASNGYIMVADEFIENPDTIWSVALEDAKIDGIQYGIPYRVSLNMEIFSREIAGDRTTWTMEEMMEAVSSSSAELLNDDYNGFSYIVSYVVNDKSNSDYIDWEKMKSHLKEEPFLKVMRFAKEYLRTEQQYARDAERSEFTRELYNGTVASERIQITPAEMGYAQYAFKSGVSYVGQPRESGSGITAYAYTMYISSTTKNIEGVREFFNFLLSETTQLKSAEQNEYHLPVRLSVMDDVLAYYKNWKNRVICVGSEYIEFKLTDEQIEQFKEFVERAEPQTDYDDEELHDIMCEELVPYLDGYRTLEEAVDIMDNRVQLYLNEHK